MNDDGQQEAKWTEMQQEDTASSKQQQFLASGLCTLNLMPLAMNVSDI